jgi:hypothetical protein
VNTGSSAVIVFLWALGERQTPWQLEQPSKVLGFRDSSLAHLTLVFGGLLQDERPIRIVVAHLDHGLKIPTGRCQVRALLRRPVYPRR